MDWRKLFSLYLSSSRRLSYIVLAVNPNVLHAFIYSDVELWASSVKSIILVHSYSLFILPSYLPGISVDRLIMMSCYIYLLSSFYRFVFDAFWLLSLPVYISGAWALSQVIFIRQMIIIKMMCNLFYVSLDQCGYIVTLSVWVWCPSPSACFSQAVRYILLHEKLFLIVNPN